MIPAEPPQAAQCSTRLPSASEVIPRGMRFCVCCCWKPCHRDQHRYNILIDILANLPTRLISVRQEQCQRWRRTAPPTVTCRARAVAARTAWRVCPLVPTASRSSSADPQRLPFIRRLSWSIVSFREWCSGRRCCTLQIIACRTGSFSSN